MKRLFPVICLFSCLIAAHSFAGSATWSSNPTSGDWNTAANWTPATVPNRTGDVATFDASNLTEIQTSLRTTVDSIVFNPAASSYTIIGGRGTTINGSGIINNSGLAQNFFGISFTFRGSATAGTNTFLTGPLAGAGVISFYETSNAGEATISNIPGPNLATTNFYDQSSAAHATLVNSTNGFNGQTIFHDQSTGGDATIINEGGTPSKLGFGMTEWYNESTAGNATVISEGATGLGTYPGETRFVGGTPANATLVAKDGIDGGLGGSIIFVASPPINTARVVLFGNGTLTVYTTTQIGSIEGDGIVTIYPFFSLTVGNNSLSTTFSGTLEGDAGTSLTKVGTGTLTLSGANTYTSGTTVLDGSLKVNNTAGSGTGTGPVLVQAGTLSGKGIIGGAVTVGTGGGVGAFLAPGKGASQPNTLTLQSALTFKADSSYVYKLNTKKAKSDQVIANGITIESGAQFDLTRVGNMQLTVGQIVTAIRNTSATAIAGTFANLEDGSTITAGVNKLQVSYSGGDGNDLTLTVVQ